VKLLRKSIPICIGFFILSITNVYGQLGFCSGNSGDPIFTETFGTGTTNGPALPAGTTTYTYENGVPQDGSYTISNNSNYLDWHNVSDITPDDSNGKFLIVNASFNAGEFFRRNISGLCENTSYEFSAWLINLLPASGCGGNGIPINVKFEIWDASDTNLLASGDTGNIQGTSTPNWEQYGLVFQTLPAQTDVILKMINNGVGGCGNDLAIDDIVFKSCGDIVTVEDVQTNDGISICENNVPFTTQLTANPDFSIFTSHAYQWQESTDNVVWTDIAGETTNTFTPTGITTTTYYRVKVAEDVVNLANPLCNVVSEVFEINVVATPDEPVSDGDIMNCGTETQSASVTVTNGVMVNWYDAASGGNLLLADSTTYPTDVAGTFYAEAETIDGNCRSNFRTPVSVVFYESPVVEDETLTFCEGTEITLYANVINTYYLWNTGENISQITVNTPGIYTVLVTTGNGCSETKTITLTQIDNPVIDNVVSDGNDIVVNTANSGDFEYSLDGNTYQLSPMFFNAEGGLYTVYVRERNGCGVDTIEHLHFVIPKFFTPNGDSQNDAFILKGIEHFASSEVHIFDRYGRLLVSSKNTAFAWDGTFKNQLLPTSDYWYVIKIDGRELKGHFTLKR
jgi:gliding motility-associated-like protein